MTEARRCGTCGAELAAEASPQGLCARCLLEAGLKSKSTGAASDSRQETSPAQATPTGPGPIQVAELARLFPQLEVQKLLGRGGMGAVYLARQKTLDRPVALKLLAPKGGTDPEFAERFAREAKALARLNHPGIVAVYDSGVVEGLYYFLMEYVSGTSLREVMRQGKLAPRQALALVPQICDALQYAHDEGVVHRDIKPENVLLDKKGRIKVADFGLAKILGQDASGDALTGSRHVMGTPHYMAPEQLEHPKQVDHRADIYSLGVVFYEMLTGELPLGRFAPPSKKVRVDVRLDEVVLRALEKEPERRYQHASDVKTDVQEIEAKDRTGAKEETAAVDFVRLKRQYDYVSGVTFGLLLLIAAWAALLLKLDLRTAVIWWGPLFVGAFFIAPLVVAIWKRGTPVGTMALIILQDMTFYMLAIWLFGLAPVPGVESSPTARILARVLTFATLVGVWAWIGETWKRGITRFARSPSIPWRARLPFAFHRFLGEAYVRLERFLHRGDPRGK